MPATINASSSSGIVTTADNSAQLELQTASTTRLTIDSSGNVGIGTASPNISSATTKALTITSASGQDDAINDEGNPVYQNVDTSFLVATLTAAIQEQQTIIETLKADIAELKAKVNQ